MQAVYAVARAVIGWWISCGGMKDPRQLVRWGLSDGQRSWAKRMEIRLCEDWGHPVHRPSFVPWHPCSELRAREGSLNASLSRVVVGVCFEKAIHFRCIALSTSFDIPPSDLKRWFAFS